MSGKLTVRIVILIPFLLAGAMLLYAQAGNEGTIEGTVTDQTGAVVSGAEITATHTTTGAAFHTTSK